MFKKLFVSLVLCLSLIATPVIADELGVGGAYVTGHSEDRDYAVNNDGWGIGAHYDKDMGWQKRFSSNNAIGVDPGMAYFFLRWEKDVEETKTHKGGKWDCYYSVKGGAICPPPPPTVLNDEFPIWNPEYTTKTSSTEWVNSHWIGATLKPYWELYEDFRFFGVGGLGYEFAEDENDAFAPLTGVGIQYMITKSIGTSVSYNAIWSNATGNDSRRFDVTMFSIDFRF